MSADYQVFNNAGTTLASNTDNVQQWNDRSGNSKNAIQIVTANKPNYVTAVINNLPAIRYTAANDDLLMSVGVSTANLASVWVVGAYFSLPSNNPGMVIGSPPSSGTNVATNDKCIGMWVSNAAGTQVWGRGVQSNNASRNISTVTTLNSNTFYIVNNMYRNAQIDQYVNNTIAGNNTAHDGTLKSWADITVGRQGNESWNGDIAEVIFYNVEVNSAQRIIVDNYLSAKYGLSLSNNDLYDKDNAGNGNFDFEVAGIGRVDATNIHNDAQGSGIVRILNPSNLGNDEFLIWGHDNGSLQATNLTDVPAGVQGRMARVWRVSEVNAAGTAVNVGSLDIRFDLSGLGSITASDLRLLVDTDNDGVFTDETGISGASLVSGSIYEFAGVTAIANNFRFTLGTINKSQTPLPIELLSFKAVLNSEKQVELIWSTATEKNNKSFEIEKSLDGESWEIVQVIEGSGTTSVKHNYQIIDPYPYPTVSYYRIKQIDFDDSYTYSPIVSIDLSQQSLNSMELYPNPTNGQITVQGNAAELTDFKIYDVIGREKEYSSVIYWLNANKFNLDLSEWPKGIYLLRSLSTVKKIIKN